MQQVFGCILVYFIRNYCVRFFRDSTCRGFIFGISARNNVKMLKMTKFAIFLRNKNVRY
jgi:hypothetical protein